MANYTRPIWSYAFRPFFLLNAGFAVVTLLTWLALMRGWNWPGSPSNPTLWHAHEMLIGFVMAAVAGFSLTAVATWTGRPALSGRLLCWLASCWLAGRLAMGFSTLLQPWLLVVLDMTFPVMLSILLSREVVAADNRRNLPVAGITILMAVINFLYHVNSTTDPGFSRQLLLGFVYLVLLLVTVIGGRIIPSFTGNWLRARDDVKVGILPRTVTWLEPMVFTFTALAGIAAVLIPMTLTSGTLAILAAVAHAGRLSGWLGWSTRSEPLLFVLHLAYAWLSAGFFAVGLANLGIAFNPSAAVHALTVGAIATMILAVMTRVALGHTGRPLISPPAVRWCYGFIALAALIRVIGPSTGAGYQVMIDLSALAWITAFLVFISSYWSILTGPRKG